jgi:hypothetical protein
MTSPQSNQPAPASSPANIDTLIIGWPDAQSNRHNVRVLCDLAALPLEKTVAVSLENGETQYFMPKDVICACIDDESNFLNYQADGQPVKHENIVNGVLESTDWGIVQCNDKAHIGPGKDFPSVEYVLANPDVMVDWMIDKFKEGRLDMWDSFSTGAFKKFLPAQ